MSEQAIERGEWVQRKDDKRIGWVHTIGPSWSTGGGAQIGAGDVEVRINSYTSIVSSVRGFWERWTIVDPVAIGDEIARTVGCSA